MEKTNKEITLKSGERIDQLNISGLKVIQNKKYFLFGMDSVLLSNFIKGVKSTDNIVDLGTGTMVMPIILSAKSKAKKIIGIELQNEMYDLAIRNVVLNKLESKLFVIHENILKVKEVVSKVNSITGLETVDIVISNPPYKEIGTGTINFNDVKYIARHEHSCKLEDIFKLGSKLLKSKGKMYIVHKPERLADLITIARKYKLEVKRVRFMQSKINKTASLVMLEYVKDGGAEVKVDSILIEYDKNGKYTKDILEIYGMENV